MRALLDANVFISYLLRPTGDTPPIAAVRAAVGGVYSLLVTGGVTAEIREKTSTKPFLADRISPAEVGLFVDLLGSVAETVPEIQDVPFPALGRDRKDDYLYAHAVVGQADYLVSGDRGVLVVGRIGDVQIVSPAEFVEILRAADLV